MRDVRDLVSEDPGEHVVVELERQHSASDEDMSGRESKGVGHRHLDDVEGERILVEAGSLGDLVADAVDALELLWIVDRLVEAQRLECRCGALVEEIGV